MSGLSLLIWNMLVFPCQLAVLQERLASHYGFDLAEEYGWTWSQLWRQLAGSVLAALPFIAWPFVARRLTGVGRRRRWADPLESPVH